MTAPTLQVGAKVWVKGKPGTIIGVVNFDTFAVAFENGDSKQLCKLAELRGTAPQTSGYTSIDAVPPERLAKGYGRYELLEPFLLGQKSGRKALTAHLKEAPKWLHLSVSNAYKCIREWRLNPSILSLIDEERNGGRGRSRLTDPVQDEAMRQAIEDHYLTRKEHSGRHVYDEELDAYCLALGCKKPTLGVFYARIRAIPEDEEILKRKGKRALKDKLGPNVGKNPYATAPLSCVQMDYWEVDAVLVDPWHRQAVGRCILCYASCSTTGMPYGYYLSYDPPNAGSAGIAIFVGATVKDELLKRLGVDMEWPVWSLPKMIHLDNAKDFRGKMLAEAAKIYGVEIVHRPVRTPHFGGHIESQFRNFAHKVAEIPGATGSKPSEKRGDPAKTAQLSIDEFEGWFMNLLKKHINTPGKDKLTPLQRWKSYFFDHSGKQKSELFPLPADPRKLRIELMPYVERTLTDEGFTFQYHLYDSQELTDLKARLSPEEKRKVKVRYDPRYVPEVYTFSKLKNDYIAIPWTDGDMSPLNRWEHEAAKKYAQKQGWPVNTSTILESHQARREILVDAAKKTRRARQELTHSEHSYRKAVEDRPRFGAGEPEEAAIGLTNEPMPAGDAGASQGAPKRRFRDLGYDT